MSFIILLSVWSLLSQESTTSGYSLRALDLCIHMRKNAREVLDKVGHIMNFSLLPSNSQVFACGLRRPSNLVLVQHFFSPNEVDQILVDLQGMGHHAEKAIPDWVERRIESVVAPSSLPQNSWVRHDSKWTLKFHIDRRGKPDRYASVLMYVETPRSGGHTLFPFVHAANLRTHEAELISNFSVLLPTPAEKRARGKITEVTQGYLHENAAKTLGASLCSTIEKADTMNSTYPFFAAAPMAGTALIFWHWEHSAQGFIPDTDKAIWHSGCPFDGRRSFVRSFRIYQELDCMQSKPNREGVPRRADCSQYPSEL